MPSAGIELAPTHRNHGIIKRRAPAAMYPHLQDHFKYNVQKFRGS